MINKSSTRLITSLAFIISLLSPFIACGETGNLKNVHQRNNFNNSRIQFERDKTGHVAFIGGSITEMNGYRPMVMKFLEEKFPDTEFKFTDAGISSTCSTAGAFRLGEDVLQNGEVDLFFVEFAVNDDQDAMHSLESSLRGMEGIIRHTLTDSPQADIILTYFVNEGMLEKLRHGETPISIAAHEKVAKHYGITSVHLAQEIADRMDAGAITWKQYGGVHPAPYGNAIPAKMISQTLEESWNQPLKLSTSKRTKQLPEKLDQFSYVHGQYLPENSIVLSDGWQKKISDWKELKGSVRARHKEVPLYICGTPGAELTFSLTGNAFGVECVAGPDAGTLLYSVDDGDWQEFNLSHRFSKGLHYPRTVVLADELDSGKHVVRIKLADKESDYGLSPAARILNFVVNTSDE